MQVCGHNVSARMSWCFESRFDYATDSSQLLFVSPIDQLQVLSGALRENLFFFSNWLEMASFRNIEESLSKHLPTDELSEVKNILYGRADE